MTLATGIGSMPGTSSAEATRIIVGELPDFVHVAELPARGPGSDMIGRTAGLLTDVDRSFGTETTPTGWRIAAAPGRSMRMARSWLDEDLDRLQESADGFTGSVKSQLAGPWTMAASVELPGGERMLRDAAACEDLAQGLAEAARLHVNDMRRRFPRAAEVVLQIDEPGIAAVVAGRVGTASGLSTYAPVDGQVASRVLATVLAASQSAGARAGVHCCSAEIPIDVLRAAGADFVSLDASGLADDRRHDQALGTLLEAGVGAWLGVVPATASGAGGSGVAQAAHPISALLHRLGLLDEGTLDQIVVTPTCGLAGADPAWTRQALKITKAVARGLRDDEESTAESADGGRR